MKKEAFEVLTAKLQDKLIVHDEVIDIALTTIESEIACSSLRKTFENTINSIIIEELPLNFGLQQRVAKLAESLQVATSVIVSSTTKQQNVKLLNYMLSKISSGRKKNAEKLLSALSKEAKQELIADLEKLFMKTNKHRSYLVLLCMLRRQGALVDAISVPPCLDVSLHQKLVAKALPHAMANDQWLRYLHCEDVLAHPTKNIVPTISIIEGLRERVKAGTLAEVWLDAMRVWAEYVAMWQRSPPSIDDLFLMVSLLEDFKESMRQMLERFYNLEKYKAAYPRAIKHEWTKAAIKQSFQYKFIEYHKALCDCILPECNRLLLTIFNAGH